MSVYLLYNSAYYVDRLPRNVNKINVYNDQTCIMPWTGMRGKNNSKSLGNLGHSAEVKVENLLTITTANTTIQMAKFSATVLLLQYLQVQQHSTFEKKNTIPVRCSAI